MKDISIDNGHSYCTIDEALEGMSWDTITNYMDPETMEYVHNNLDGEMTEANFLRQYLETADNDLIIG